MMFWGHHVPGAAIAVVCLLEAGLLDVVTEAVRRDFRIYLGGVWEDLARSAVPWLSFEGRRALIASRWWGAAAGGPVELDIVAGFADGRGHLIGEAKLSISALEAERLLRDLRLRGERCPGIDGPLEPVLFVLDVPPELREHPRIVGPEAVLVSRGTAS